MTRIVYTLSATFALAVFALANPEDEVLVAPEFTFTSPALLAAEEFGDNHKRAYLDHIEPWLEKAKAACRKDPGCDKVEIGDGLRHSYGRDTGLSFDTYFTVRFKDGSYLEVTYDSKVLEVKVPWRPLRWWRENRDRIQNFAFQLSEEVGLKPHPKVGMGHLTRELRSLFGDDVFLLRQYLADRYNHWEFASGLFVNDATNAVPLARKGDAFRARFQALLSEVDSGKIRTVDALVDRLTSDDLGLWEKETEIRFLRSLPDQVDMGLVVGSAPGASPGSQLRLEDRAMFAQRNVDEFILFADLQNARVTHLRTVKEPIALAPAPGPERIPVDLVRRFRRYVAESGRDFLAYYETFVPAAWKRHAGVKRIGELARVLHDADNSILTPGNPCGKFERFAN